MTQVAGAQEIKVLDKGFVRLENHVGGDESVIRSARVSYQSKAGDPERDRKLIAYLIDHEHMTPLEHNHFTFHVKCPLFVRSQWHRHRTGVSYNEVSARYTEMKDEFYVPKTYRAQDTKNKQGSVAADLEHEAATRMVERASYESYDAYKNLIALGVAREMARMVLPVNLYTEFYFTCNARSLLHFIRLRSEAHAQFEMRQYSNALWKLFAPLMPWTASAFLGTLNLSRYTSMEGLPGPNINDTLGSAA